MSGWSEDELTRIGGAEELGIASQRADGSMRSYVTIWVVRAGDDVFVRSASGTDNPWFRRAVAAGVGRVRAGGLERDVAFERIGTEEQETHAAIDAAYHAKYDRHGPAIVGTVVGQKAAESTLRLVRRPS